MSRLAPLLVLVPLAACQPASPPEATGATSDAVPVAAAARDAILLASAKAALPPPGITAGDLPDPGSPGAQLLATHCAQCHELPTPLMHSATDWPSVARRMWLRMDRLPEAMAIAVPDQAARSMLLSYLTANALPITALTLPEGPGLDTFEAICSRCHTLPDPRVHAPEDWLTVYLRMERNMERMNVAPATRAETEAILGYLQEVSAR